MMSLTRKYTFSASHRLHVNAYSESQNDSVFGKCNHPFGHGHNYEIFVTARGPVNEESGLVLDPRELDTLVRKHVIDAFHLKNINLDIPVFVEVVPTTENIGTEITRRLQEHWSEEFPAPGPVLEKVRILETDRNIFEVFAS